MPEQMRFLEPGNPALSTVQDLEEVTKTVHIRTYHFPQDHFGVIADPLMRVLMDQTETKRARKSAFNALGRMLHSTKQIEKGFHLLDLGYTVGPDGSLWITCVAGKGKQA